MKSKIKKTKNDLYIHGILYINNFIYNKQNEIIKYKYIFFSLQSFLLLIILVHK